MDFGTQLSNWKLNASSFHATLIFYINYPPPPLGNDIALSLEAAEHIYPESSNEFISSLCAFSDIVLFSGASLCQGGIGHINERYPSYWASIFMANNFYPFDLFRPVLWGQVGIQPWYQQNAYLYVKKNSTSYNHLLSFGIQPVLNHLFLDAYHPILFIKRSSFLGFCKYQFHRFLPDRLLSFSSYLYNRLISIRSLSL